ncbi:hypothetical protein [Acidovorax sp. SRB_24]|uniref:hypothetical protein n=1 Tax=Acidovorax sp. SRB_24 TaxID=1962700 RepID=UPI00145C5F75|nr:hypothetical protein [Acidovorax sp. SRB_24]NMM76670.1 hypothetical protein [Acidovorax sp. SRB_24]
MSPQDPHRPATPAPAQRSVDTTQKTLDAPSAGADATPPEGTRLPKLPHERDQSVGMTDGIPSADIQQAYRDVQRGLVDTDAGREAHNVGKPVQPPEPAPPGTPGPVEPDRP